MCVLPFFAKEYPDCCHLLRDESFDKEVLSEIVLLYSYRENKGKIKEVIFFTNHFHCYFLFQSLSSSLLKSIH